MGPYEQANNFPEILRFREDIRLQSLQFARPRSQPLRKFSLLYNLQFSNVKNVAIELHRHRVRVYNNYARTRNTFLACSNGAQVELF